MVKPNYVTVTEMGLFKLRYKDCIVRISVLFLVQSAKINNNAMQINKS